MHLAERLEKDFVTALKAKKTEEVAVLRMLRAAAKNKQIIAPGTDRGRAS